MLANPAPTRLARGYHGWLAWARQRHIQYRLAAGGSDGRILRRHAPAEFFRAKAKLAALGRELLDDDQFAQTPAGWAARSKPARWRAQANWVASLFAAGYWPAARMLARLIELVRLSQGSAGYQARAVALDPQRAVAAVVTARGLLLRGGGGGRPPARVADWRILPPTA